MAKYHYVKRARKEQGLCDRCGDPINVGDSYVWLSQQTSTHTSVKKRRHLSCPDWRPSDLTLGSLQPLHLGIEEAEDAIGEATTVDDLREISEEFVERVERFMADAETKYRNLVSGFGHETASSRLQSQRIAESEVWVETVREFAGGLEDEPICPICAGTGRRERVEGESQTDDGMLPCEACDQTGRAPQHSDALDEYVRLRSYELQEIIDVIPFD